MNGGIEIIRIIAVILITFTHTRNNLTDGWGYFIIEELPAYGTAVLSIISGYLFYNSSKKTTNLFSKKVHSLAIPYLIANGLVLILALLCYYILDINLLNRLDYNYQIITEGLLSFNSPPINPPTYFIKDIFVLFCLISLVKDREMKTLLVLIPLVIFGHLFYRIDIVFLFVLGVIYSHFKDQFKGKYWLVISIIALLINGVILPSIDLKYTFAFTVFLLFINFKLPSLNLGSYSYLLHLYHSPMMVVSYSIYNRFIVSEFILVILQILTALFGTFILFLIIKKYPILKIISGGR